MVTLELEKTDLLFQQCANGRVELRNATRNPLRHVNPDSRDGFPLLVLKDLATEEVYRFTRSPFPGTSQPAGDLSPGQSLSSTFRLTAEVSVPHPGKFELTAVYQWSDGSATSQPLVLNIRATHPMPDLHAVSALGGLCPVYYAAWLNRTRPGQDAGDLCVSTFRTTSPPDLPNEPPELNHTPVAQLQSRVHPYMSVPPNTEPDAQWVAWLEGEKLAYVLHKSGEATPVESFDVGAKQGQIIPPLLAHPRTKDRKPGASVLLYRPHPEEHAGQLVVAELKFGARPQVSVAVSAPAFEWAETAYLSDCRRRTFFLTANPHRTRLNLLLSTWSSQKPPAPPQSIYTWETRLVASSLSLTREGDLVRGIILGELPGENKPIYELHAWVHTPEDGLTTADPIRVQLPEDARVDLAVARIDQNGGPCAFLRCATKWMFCSHDGSVRPLKNKIQPPVEILFELAEMPILMYTEPGRGFQFLRPG
jgi:hypothetical protein